MYDLDSLITKDDGSKPQKVEESQNDFQTSAKKDDFES